MESPDASSFHVSPKSQRNPGCFSELELSFLACKHPVLEGIKNNLRDSWIPPFGNQIIQTIDSKKLKFTQKSHAGWIKWVCYQPEGEIIFPGKRFHTALTTCQATLMKRMELNQWWVRSYPDQDCWAMETFCSLFKSKHHNKTTKRDLVNITIANFFIFPMKLH